MGVAVLYPENCLRDTFPHQNRRLISPLRSKSRRSPSKQTPTPANTRSGRRKPQSTPSASPPPQTQTGPGQIRILKRGQDPTPYKQSIATTTPPKNQSTTKRESSVDRVNSSPTISLFGPGPGPNPLLNGFYAGSAIFTSPPPSSVPVPAFCTKSIAAGDGVLTRSSAEEAAFDLRRILRLE